METKRDDRLAQEEPKFEVGSPIRWVEDLVMTDPLDTNEEVKCRYAEGIIKSITPHTVVINITHSHRETGIKRVSKILLAYEVFNEELAQIILATDGIPTKTEKPIPHKVYGLKDPRDDSFHYIGISKNVERRFEQHIQCQGLNFELHIWIQDLLSHGLFPSRVIFEEVIGRKAAQEREVYWIRHYQKLNAPLTNIASADHK